MARKQVARVAAFVAAWCCSAAPHAAGWWTGSHGIVARAAADSLSDDVPVFFRLAGDTLAYFAATPDLLKNPATPHLRDAEWPEHFLDYELLEGRSLPPLRWQYVALCGELRRSPREIGFLPYAVVEWTERLTLAFAEQRRLSGSPQARQKCLVFGGMLSHYAADLAQPLHLTISYDGRAEIGSPSPRTGIHERMDALIQAAQIRPPDVAAEVKPVVFKDTFAAVVEELVRTRGVINLVYALEPELPTILKGEGLDPNWKPSEHMRALALDRARAAASLTASCWLTAWTRSREVEAHVPVHLVSEIAEESAPPRAVWWIAAIVVGAVLAASMYRLGQRAGR